jgi:hypothetical protein
MICNSCTYKMHRECKGCPCQHQTGPGHVNPKALKATLTPTQSPSVPSSPTSEAKSEKVSQHQ